MKSNKIRNREKLAGELGISPRALRLQVFRVRERLQPCSAAASIFAGPRNKSCVLLNYMMEEYLMTRYLLDELGEEVLTRFEERFFIDDDAFDRLLEAEEYFLMSPQRREHVEITRALLASSKKSRVRPARWYILIAAGILIVCGFSWFGIETYRLRSRLVFDLKPASAYLPYRVAIRTVEGEEIWSQDLPVPQAELSPNVLTPRDYLVRVQAARPVEVSTIWPLSPSGSFDSESELLNFFFPVFSTTYPSHDPQYTLRDPYKSNRRCADTRGLRSVSIRLRISVLGGPFTSPPPPSAPA